MTDWKPIAEQMIRDRQRNYCNCHADADYCGTHRILTDDIYEMAYDAAKKAMALTGVSDADPDGYATHSLCEEWATAYDATH